jgi:hypothetical protein
MIRLRIPFAAVSHLICTLKCSMPGRRVNGALKGADCTGFRGRFWLFDLEFYVIQIQSIQHLVVFIPRRRNGVIRESMRVCSFKEQDW